MLSTGHTLQKPLSVKSESGHWLKCLCLLQALKFPQENSVFVIKTFLAFFGSSFSIPLYLAVSPAGVRLFFNKLPCSEASHCVAYLYHARDTWLCCVRLIILVTCWSHKRNFSPKARMPFLVFPCDAVFSLHGLPSKSESLEWKRHFPWYIPWKQLPGILQWLLTQTSRQHHHMVLLGHCKAIKLYFSAEERLFYLQKD